MRTPREVYEAYLTARGEELSAERAQVLSAVFAIHHHFTLEELAGAMDSPAPGRALEEMLFEMVQAGLIRKVYFGTDRVYYEHVYGHAHHDHLFCLGCGRIVEFTSEAIERLQEEIARQHDFHVVRHAMQIIGLCPDCQRLEIPHEHEYFPTDEERHGPAVPLSLVKGGEWVTLVDFRGGEGLRHRLAAMGLAKGDSFQVLVNAFAGPMTIRVRDTSLALGHGLSHKLLVRIDGDERTR